MRVLGTLLSTALTGSVVLGIAAIIALDFEGPIRDMIAARDDAQRSEIEKIFEEVDSITFFIKRPVDAFDINIMTGAQFDSPAAVEARTPQSQWCYVNFYSGGVTQKIDLGTRTDDKDPNYHKLSHVDPDLLHQISLTSAFLEAVARTHCVFDNFDPRDAQS